MQGTARNHVLEFNPGFQGGDSKKVCDPPWGCGCGVQSWNNFRDPLAPSLWELSVWTGLAPAPVPAWLASRGVCPPTLGRALPRHLHSALSASISPKGPVTRGVTPCFATRLGETLVEVTLSSSRGGHPRRRPQARGHPTPPFAPAPPPTCRAGAPRDLPAPAAPLPRSP